MGGGSSEDCKQQAREADTEWAERSKWRERAEGHRATRGTDIFSHFNKCIKIGSSARCSLALLP